MINIVCPACSSRQDVAPNSDSAVCANCGIELLVSVDSFDDDAGQIDSSRLPATRIFDGAGINAGNEVDAIPRKLGRFEIREYLGGGGFARVYRATDHELGREVAIKVPRPDRFQSEADLEQFFDEARIVARLEHPGIVQVYDVGETDGIRYIVCQFIPGGTLAHRLKPGCRVTFRQAARWIAQCAEAIHFAHRQSLFHRDLKPLNILIDSDDRAWVADFGLAIHRRGQSQHAGQIAGTVLYMAPEQIRGDSHLLDGRADTWSLGVVLYLLLSGQLPFQGDFADLRTEILEREPAPPRQLNESVPEELQRICLKCLAKSPGDRYASAFDLAQDLKRWLAIQTESDSSVRTVQAADHDTDRGHQLSTDVVRDSVSVVARSPDALAMIAGSFVLVAFAVVAIVAAAIARSVVTDSDQAAPQDPAAFVVREPATSVAGQSLFDIDDYAVAGRWYDLLTQRPRKTLLSAGHLGATISHDELANKVTIQTPHVGYAATGETQSETFRIQVRLSRTNWRGACGIWWGYRMAPYVNQDRVPQCEALWGYGWKEGDQMRYRLEWAHVAFVKNAEEAPGTHEIPHFAEVVDLPKHGEATLEVQVLHGRIHRVIWCGQLISRMVDAARDIEPWPPNGDFGLMSTRGSTLFHEARIQFSSDEDERDRHGAQRK